MDKLSKSLRVIATAIIVMCASAQSSLAQNSGVGSDLFTRILWTSTDGAAVIYKLNANLNIVLTTTFTSVNQWLPIALTVAANNDTYLLWRRTDGLVSIYMLDPNLFFIKSVNLGPIPGWTADHLSTDTNGVTSTLRLSWRNTDGEFALWFLQPNLTLSLSVPYGPFFGYVPGD
jgi:hypothetical protein